MIKLLHGEKLKNQEAQARRFGQFLAVVGLCCIALVIEGSSVRTYQQDLVFFVEKLSSDLDSGEHGSRSKQEPSSELDHLPSFANLTAIHETLPVGWRDYFEWHNEMRRRFLDESLLTDPDSPGVFVYHTLRWGNGGLNDRVQKMERALVYAKMTRRVLLIKWYHPFPLETFLQPAAINWTAPYHDSFQSEEIFKATYYAGKNSPNPKIMVNYHEKAVLEPGIGKHAFWNTLFQPSLQLESMVLREMRTLSITPGAYTAVHLRVRHPVIYRNERGNIPGRNGSNPDSTGLLWSGKAKKLAVDAGIHALQCQQQLVAAEASTEPVYLLSDSEDLVTYLINRGNERHNTPPQTNASWSNTDDASAYHHIREILSNLNLHLVARNISVPTAHLDLALDAPWEAYAATFVDLYMAVYARCMSYNVGNFGRLAVAISGTSCFQRNEQLNARLLRKWGMEADIGAPFCILSKNRP